MGKKHRCAVVIIGGGFSGAAVAWHLRRQGVTANIIIIEPRSEIGRGLAYSTVDPGHRVNVPATRMNIAPDLKDHFQNWLIESGDLSCDPQAQLPDGRSFPTREAFGRYIVAQIRELKNPVTHVTARAVDATALSDGYRIACDNGDVIDAEFVVLAVCHAPPGIPSSLKPLQSHSRFIADPWQTDGLRAVAPTDRVLIVGSGLTMADIVVSLDRQGHRGKITAVSRRGLTSQPHTENPASFDGDFLTPPVNSASALSRHVRHMISASHLPWQTAIDRIREQGQELWQNLNPAARFRLLRHLRPYWDTHRFRVAPQLHGMLQRRKTAGTLSIEAASVRAHTSPSNNLMVELRPRHSTQWKAKTFDTVILATGPAHAAVIKTDPLLSQMNAHALIRTDQLGIGIETDRNGNAIGHNDAPQPALFIAGPIARGTFGELMGIEDLATYAQKIAEQIAGKLNTRQN